MSRMLRPCTACDERCRRDPDRARQKGSSNHQSFLVIRAAAAAPRGRAAYRGHDAKPCPAPS
ncbi:hypothetical protein FOB31_15295 [Burkholderia multivorans]|nr:hypothetical protein FOB31_15295 [Burkholderia multivorans]QET41493.1 hypothetical protein FOB30_28570 [Burkholderia multivorans]